MAFQVKMSWLLNYDASANKVNLVKEDFIDSSEKMILRGYCV